MNLEESLNKLFSLHQFGIKLGLEKPKHLFNFLGNPQKELKCFHIAGSNGKGSVASFISSILIEDGYKVGLYTSPHFVKFNERIRINGVMIDDAYVMNFMNELNEYIDKNEPTFFELTTAMAFKYFKDNNVDYAVIETGLGGRLDATNVINPVASVITTISLEHTNILGNSIEEIAYEKGEIIKSHSKAFIGILPPKAKEVLQKKAVSVDTEFYNLEDNLIIEEDHVILKTGESNYHLYTTPLFGKYQLKNAALAILSIINCMKLNSTQAIFSGVKNVIKNSGIQGRYEVFNETPRVILDSSHNEEGITNFLNEFKVEKDKYKSREVIFGVMKDKNIKEMLKQLDNNFDKIFVTSFNYERAATVEQIMNIAEELNINIEVLVDPSKYIQEFILEKTEKCLVVLGSIYLLGEIKSKLMEKKLDI